MLIITGIIRGWIVGIDIIARSSNFCMNCPDYVPKIDFLASAMTLIEDAMKPTYNHVLVETSISTLDSNAVFDVKFSLGQTI